MKVALIVAMDLERGIGKNNDLMWHLPADMKFFKETTLGHVVVMGRKNWDSIPTRYRPLSERENVVLTRNKSFHSDDCVVLHDISDVWEKYRDEEDRTVFIIGGGEIYNISLESNFVETMYITHVNGRYGADTFFPDFDLKKWKVEAIHSHEKDEKHENAFQVNKYTRI
ncbi:MAG: dihydrofolate reductase [Bacteroidota bacterium]